MANFIIEQFLLFLQIWESSGFQLCRVPGVQRPRREHLHAQESGEESSRYAAAVQAGRAGGEERPHPRREADSGESRPETCTKGMTVFLKWVILELSKNRCLFWIYKGWLHSLTLFPPPYKSSAVSWPPFVAMLHVTPNYQAKMYILNFSSFDLWRCYTLLYLCW